MPKLKKKSLVKHPCEKCGVVLSSMYNLRIHTETNCSKDKRFICEVCDSRFLTHHSLKTHINSLHFGEKNFSCQFCGKKYLTKGQLKVHERSHTKEKTFICGICNKGFSHRESLVTHSTIHSGIKPYICECCSATFSCVGNLIKHRKVRPKTCGLPIYTNKKICKRAGVKCKGKKPQIIVDCVELTFNEPVQGGNEDIARYYASQDSEIHEVEQIHLSDHQYVADGNPNSEDSQLEEDFSKKEMDVFDYIGIEIKNIQEQERKQQLENEAAELIAQELLIEESKVDDLLVEESIEEFFIESTEIVDNDGDTIIIERLEPLDENEEMANYVEIVDSTSFHCKLCPKIYQKKNITVKHLKSEHQIILKSYNYDNSNRYRKPQKDLDWKCRYCPRKYTSKRLAERHEKFHGPLGILVHKCCCCSIYFETIEEMEAHQSSEHKDRLICKIDTCNKKFDHPEKLISHTKYAHSKKKMTTKKYTFVCQLCGRNFNTRVALSDHERSNCGKTPIYECSFCEKNYHSAGSLKCHLTVHAKALDFDCTFCQKKFRTKGQLTVHLRSHTHEKNYKCSHCTAEFSHRESLLTHNTLHTGIKRFECSSCGSRFSCISNLLAHRKSSSHKNTCGDSKTNKVVDAENSVKMCKKESLQHK